MKVKIEKLDHFGNGITHINNKICFVSKCLPGEEVEIDIVKETSKYYQAIVTKLLKSSDRRIECRCPYFEKCGGCQLLNLNYEDTVTYKHQKIKEILNNKLSFMDNINIIRNDSSHNYRNKVTFKVKDGVIGFYELNSHNLIKVDKCLLLKDSINNVIPYLSKLNIKDEEIIIRSNYLDELLIIINTNANQKFDFEKLLSHNNVVGIIINNKTIHGNNYFYEKINNLVFKVSYNSFFQINSNINSKLFDIIDDNLRLNDNVLDLYCGVGTLGCASKKANSIIGIDINDSNIKDAINNAMDNNVSAKYICGDVKDHINYLKDSINTIIIDPPRSGMDKDTINNIMKISPTKIIYVSCDVMTLVRDLNQLSKSYTIHNISVLDMFSYTYHVETVVVLHKM